MNRSVLKSYLVATTVLILLCLMSAVSGPVDVTLSDVFTDTGTQGSEVFWNIRLPRILLGGLVGAALAISGAIYQGVFNNPLADPFLLGVSSGAALGATLVISVGIAAASMTIAAGAAAGAVFAVFAVIALARAVGLSTSSLILAGIAVAAFAGAMQVFVLAQDSDTIEQIVFWSLGGLVTSGWSEVLVVLVGLIPALVFGIAIAKYLEVLRVGELESSSLGLNVSRVRSIAIAVATLATAAAVSVSGLIGFVGLVVPHAVRLAISSNYQRLVPLAAIWGAALIVGADVLSRTITSFVIPVGILTSAIGAPFFAYLLIRSQRSGLSL